MFTTLGIISTNKSINDRHGMSSTPIQYLRAGSEQISRRLSESHKEMADELSVMAVFKLSFAQKKTLINFNRTDTRSPKKLYFIACFRLVGECSMKFTSNPQLLTVIKLNCI